MIQDAKNHLETLSNLDRIVHEPARLMILALLYVVEEADFTFILRQSGLTWGNLSSHLTKLETRGYVQVTKRFVAKKPNTVLRLTEAGRTAFQDYRRSMTEILEQLPE
ncbi:MAG: transcriptional regulator [Acidobacteriota bacterium]|nr:transcriptional regulator [Acidobacteriota bacterium]